MEDQQWAQCTHCGDSYFYLPDMPAFCSHSCQVAHEVLPGHYYNVPVEQLKVPTAGGSSWPAINTATRHDEDPSDADDEGPVLPTDSEERKEIPVFSGVLNYFPLAIAAIARVSKRGNDKHNPGQAIHWSRDKSTDHADCIARHLLDIETVDAKTGEYEDAQALAWRALAKLQLLEETRLSKPISRGSRQ